MLKGVNYKLVRKEVLYQLQSSMKIWSGILMCSADMNSPEESAASSMSFSINSHLKKLFGQRTFGVLVKAFAPCYWVVILVFCYKIFSGCHHVLFTNIASCLVLLLVNVWVLVMALQTSFSQASWSTLSRYVSWRLMSKAQLEVRSWATSLLPHSSSASKE